MRKYPLAYSIETPKTPRTKEELLAKNMGGCDAIILHSILYPDDGGRSEQLLCVDGVKGDMAPIEIFKSWVMMAHTLMNMEDLPTGRRSLAAFVFETFRMFVLDKKLEVQPAVAKAAVAIHRAQPPGEECLICGRAVDWEELTDLVQKQHIGVAQIVLIAAGYGADTVRAPEDEPK